MGSNVAPFVLPFSDKPQRGVIQYAGDGFSVMSYSKHQKEAVQFLKFMMTGPAQRIIATAGLIPDIKGYGTKSPIQNAMLAFAAKKGYTPYPMLDNVVQGEVVTAGQKQLDAAFGGDIKPLDAAKSLKSALDELPASRRGPVYSG
jgi:raffinose/stachyose/melibiose transport system substrate-binding protein